MSDLCPYDAIVFDLLDTVYAYALCETVPISASEWSLAGYKPAKRRRGLQIPDEPD